MKFYEITLKSVPRIKFACAVSVKRYKNQFKRIENFLEIAVNTGGDICISHQNGAKEWSFEGMVTPVTQDMNCKMFAEEGICQSHVTVGVDVKYDCVLHDTDNMDNSSVINRVYNEGAILIPYLFPLDERYEDCVKLIRTIITKNTEQTQKKYCEVVAGWFRLVGKLTEIVVNEIEEKDERISPYSSHYFETARKYILDNYARRLSVNEVAKQTGISSGYLQVIFKKLVGMSVTEYINYHKIQLAKQYIQGRGLSLREICFQLGFDDPAYMSRLFKKTEGISYREYCQKYLK